MGYRVIEPETAKQEAQPKPPTIKVIIPESHEGDNVAEALGELRHDLLKGFRELSKAIVKAVDAKAAPVQQEAPLPLPEPKAEEPKLIPEPPAPVDLSLSFDVKRNANGAIQSVAVDGKEIKIQRTEGRITAIVAEINGMKCKVTPERNKAGAIDKIKSKLTTN